MNFYMLLIKVKYFYTNDQLTVNFNEYNDTR